MRKLDPRDTKRSFKLQSWLCPSAAALNFYFRKEEDQNYNQSLQPTLPDQDTLTALLPARLPSCPTPAAPPVRVATQSSVYAATSCPLFFLLALLQPQQLFLGQAQPQPTCVPGLSTYRPLCPDIHGSLITSFNPSSDLTSVAPPSRTMLNRWTVPRHSLCPPSGFSFLQSI